MPRAGARREARRLEPGARGFVCGLVVMVLTVGAFSAVNSASIQLGTVGAWFAADVVVNLAIMFGMGALVKKGRA